MCSVQLLTKDDPFLALPCLSNPVLILVIKITSLWSFNVAYFCTARTNITPILTANGAFSANLALDDEQL